MLTLNIKQDHYLIGLHIAGDPKLVWDILEDGAARAKHIAEQTMTEVRAAVGLP